MSAVWDQHSRQWEPERQALIWPGLLERRCSRSFQEEVLSKVGFEEIRDSQSG